MVETLQLKLKSGADLSRIKEELRPMPRDKEEWLENYIGKLVVAGMVFANRYAICYSVAMAMPEVGCSSFTMVADYGAANAHMELVPSPISRLEEATSLSWGRQRSVRWIRCEVTGRYL